MKRLFILLFSIVMAGEMEVDGDLKVVGNVQVGTIDSLEHEIVTLKLIIAQLQAQIALLQSQMSLVGSDFADCFGVVGGNAVVDECGVCDGNNESMDVCGECGGDAISESECYETVQIGDQLWMTENLKVTNYRDGSAIPNITNNGDWSGLSTGAYGDYDNNPTNSETYGRLYNWYTVDDSRGVCPEGWHVPSDGEYTVLIDYLGGSSVAGGKMKSTGIIEDGDGLWYSPNGGASNESGFTGLPAGYRYHDGGYYSMLGNAGYFWSSSEASSSYAWYRILHSGVSSVTRLDRSKQFGFSIRCLGD